MLKGRTMLFCIDIGNTNIVLGVTDADQILEHWRIRTEKDVTADELGILIRNLFNSSEIRMNDITDIIISCVVPPPAEYSGGFCESIFRNQANDCGPGSKNRYAHTLR